MTCDAQSATKAVLARMGMIRRKSRLFLSVQGLGPAIAVLLTAHAAVPAYGRSPGPSSTQPGKCFFVYKKACCAPPFLGQDSGEGFVAGGSPSRPLTPEAFRQIAALPGVADAAPCLLYRVREGERELMMGGIGPAPSSATASTCGSAADILAGRFLMPGDSGVAVVEEFFAAAGNPGIGGILSLHGIQFRIVGVIKSGIRAVRPDVTVTLGDAERVISASAGMTLSGLANIALVESTEAVGREKTMELVSELLGGAVCCPVPDTSCPSRQD